MKVETIFSVPLKMLTDVCPDLDEYWLTQLVAQVSQLGKEYERYYLINAGLTINNNIDEARLNIFNNFVVRATQKGQLIQFMKQNKPITENEPVERVNASTL